MFSRVVVSKAELQAAEAYYYEERTRNAATSTCSRSFADMLALFSNVSLTKKERAKQAGISTNAMDAQEQTHFVHLFGKSVLDRRAEYLARLPDPRLAAISAEFRELPFVKHMLPSIVRAGLTIEPVISHQARGNGTRPVLIRTAVSVSGLRCRVFPVASAGLGREKQPERYGRARISVSALGDAPFCIKPILVPDSDLGTLVIPSEVLIDDLEGRGKDRDLFYVSLRAHKEAIHRKPRINLRSFDERWDLIIRASMEP